MGLYSDKYKHTCSKIVIGVSFLMGLMALLAVIFGFIQMGKIPMSDATKSNFAIPGIDGASKGIGMGNVAIGIVGLLVACLGCLTGKKKNFCFALPYGLLTFIITIIFLILALAAFALASTEGQAAIYAAACSGTITVPAVGGKPAKSIKSNVNLSDQYTKFVDQPICSMYCPCPFASAFKGTDANLSQAKLMKWGRFCNTGTSGGSNCIGYTALSSSSKTDGMLQM